MVLKGDKRAKGNHAMQFVAAVPSSRRPKGKGRPPKFIEEAQALQSNPCQWAVIEMDSRKSAYAWAQRIRNGEAAAFRVGEGLFEAKARDDRLYLRFIPEGVAV